MGLGATAGISRAPALFALTAIAAAIAGCASVNNPERLFPVPAEMGSIADAQDDIAKQYAAALGAGAFDRARSLRNELIAQRMYAIDAQYSVYEAALTQGSQKVGFAALTTAEGLSTAATLLTPIVTKSILSGLTTAIVATKGHYDSEVLLALTMRTIQKQMRASRNNVATHIAARMNLGVADYPLSAALSDVEDYYRAGTLTSGVIDTSTTVGQAERQTQLVKQEVTRAPLSARARLLVANTTTPIPAPIDLGIVNPAGLPGFEGRLRPVQIQALRKFACLPESGPFTAGLRAGVLKRLGNQKDLSLPDRITAIDFQNVRDELRAVRDGAKPDPCPH